MLRTVFSVLLLCQLALTELPSTPSTSTLASTSELGSGDYYDDDDDYSYYDYDHGSGLEELDDEELLKLEQDVARKVSHKEEKKTKNDDIHFNDDNLLSEYYNEFYEPDYDQLDEDLEPIDKSEDGKSGESSWLPEATEPELSPNEDSFFKLSYLYILLASAFVSFALFLALFLICRRSFNARKTKNVPFVVSDHHQFMSSGKSMQTSPIVKNYQRVPTKDSALNMNYSEKPLLN